MSRYDAVLFDFDGVLVDSEPVHYGAWVDTLAPEGVTVGWEDYRRHCVGISDRELLNYFGALATPPLDWNTLSRCYTRKKEAFRDKMAALDPVPAETIGLLGSLQGIKMAVVTSSGRLEVEPILRKAGVDRMLGAMVFGEDVERRKPDPAPYLLAASRLGARAPLVVEDSAAGMASGRAAGFDVLEVSHPAAVPGQVRAALGL